MISLLYLVAFLLDKSFLNLQGRNFFDLIDAGNTILQKLNAGFDSMNHRFQCMVWSHYVDAGLFD